MHREHLEGGRATQRVGVVTSVASNFGQPAPANTVDSNGTIMNYYELTENAYGPQIVMAAATAASDNENSTNSTWSNSRGSTTTASRRLNLVLPDTKKGTLQTPTIITSEPTNACLDVIGMAPGPAGPQTATSQLLLDSLAQFNGQDGVSLFTGLPSCTPTSADRLTGINPFFWGATAFQGGEHSAAPPPQNGANPCDNNNNNHSNNNLNGGPNIVTNGCNASDNEAYVSSESAGEQQARLADKQAAAQRRDHLMVKLAHEHAQAASSNLSPIIFSPLSLFGLSPEQEALIRFGVLSPNQHPLAGRSGAGVDFEHLSQQYNAHHVLLQHHHHQQQQHQQQHQHNHQQQHQQHQQQHQQHLQQTQQQAQPSQLHHYHRDLTNHNHNQINNSSSATMPTVHQAASIYSLEPHHQYHHYPLQQPQPAPPVQSQPQPPANHQLHQQHPSSSPPAPPPQPEASQPQQPATQTNLASAAPVSTSQQQQSVLQSPSQQQAVIAMHSNTGQPIGLFEPQIRRIYLQYHHQQQQQRQQQQQQRQQQQQQQQPNISIKPQSSQTRITSLPPTTAATHEAISRSASSSNISAISNIDPLASASGTCSPIKRHDTVSPAPTSKTAMENTAATCASTSNSGSAKYLGQATSCGQVCNNNNSAQDGNQCGKDNDARPVSDVNSTGEVIVKKKSKGGRKKKLVSHEEMIVRKNRSKERNRVAAKRCRQKRKQFLDTLRDRIDCLNELNSKLMKENSMLKSELDLLKRQPKSCLND